MIHLVGGSVTSGSTRRSIRFDKGFWWYLEANQPTATNLTCIIRESSFHASLIARNLGIGERTFHRLVKDSLGISPGVWLRWERAVFSGYRIKEGCPVKLLALELGFANPGDFAVEFKRWHGTSPSQFASSSRPRLLN